MLTRQYFIENYLNFDANIGDIIRLDMSTLQSLEGYLTTTEESRGYHILYASMERGLATIHTDYPLCISIWRTRL